MLKFLRKYKISIVLRYYGSGERGNRNLFFKDPDIFIIKNESSILQFLKEIGDFIYIFLIYDLCT